MGIVRREGRLVVLLLCLPSLCRTQDAQAIVSELRNQRYPQALEMAERALKSRPASAQILTLEGLAFRGLHRDSDALAAFRKALGADPDYVAALEGAAQLEYAAGRAEAIPLLDRLLKLRPVEPTAHAMRGVMAWKQHDCGTAVNHFASAGAEIASQPEALREYAICLARLKRFPAAEEIFQQLLSTNPADSQVRRSLAAVQLLAGRHEAALESLSPLIGAEPPDGEGLALASAVYEASGETPKAVAALRQAIVSSPRTVSYYLDFANLSFAHKSYDAGIQMLNAGLQLLPDSPPLYLARGILYVQTGRTEEADQDFALAERRDPRQPGTVDARVLERLQRNDLTGAAELVREQLKSSPRNAFLHYLLAEVLNRQGPAAGSPEFRKALAAAEEAVRLQPDLNLARNLLSRLYFDNGQAKLAIAQCRAVLQADPHDPVAIYRLMRALKSGGDPQAAAELPDLLRRFNEARELASQKEAQESRYRLVDASAAPRP